MVQAGVFVPQLFDPPQPKKKTVGRTAILPEEQWDELERVSKFETQVNTVGGVEKVVSVNKVLATAVGFFLRSYRRNVGVLPPENETQARIALAEVVIEKRKAEAERLEQLRAEGADDVDTDDEDAVPPKRQ